MEHLRLTAVLLGLDGGEELRLAGRTITSAKPVFFSSRLSRWDTTRKGDDHDYPEQSQRQEVEPAETCSRSLDSEPMNQGQRSPKENLPDGSCRFILEPVEKPNEETDGTCTSPPVRISSCRFNVHRCYSDR